ncbi:MAG: ATP phosphoribosyltransferase regulatory subunit [Clostridia bacterium]|nr:ATP phosphoribosyltransferase regulatory subunit [Clostridia bacterium]
MTLNDSLLKSEEKAIFALRQLYAEYGYSQYKMSKFEEYDLYVRNKDFLISDSIITFTDTNGKLMALKPDVTLSILKNGKDAVGQVQKVYYNENVYRVSGGTHSFKEIMQVGLECIGDIDDYSLYEVILLAAKSLASISISSVLDISHLGILSAVFDAINVSESDRAALIRSFGEKNIHELAAKCESCGISKEDTALLKSLLSLYGKPSDVLPKLKLLLDGKIDGAPLQQFENILSSLKKSEIYGMLRIDFSVVHDFGYYNGIVFKGFIEGIPEGVLSGGQYDKLLYKMGRKSGAIGFAVYLDLLERMNGGEKKNDVDILLVYNDTTPLSLLAETVKSLSSSGKSVMAQKEIPQKIKYAKLMKIDENGVREI